MRSSSSEFSSAGIGLSSPSLRVGVDVSVQGHWKYVYGVKEDMAGCVGRSGELWWFR